MIATLKSDRLPIRDTTFSKYNHLFHAHGERFTRPLPKLEVRLCLSILSELKSCRNVPFVNPFEFLGVEPVATEQEIRSAYRRKLKQLHPDKHVGAPEHIVTQLAEFTRQLNDIYQDLNNNLDYYRTRYVSTQPTATLKTNPFNFPPSTLSQLESANLSSVDLDQILGKLRFPRGTSNLAFTAIRMRSLALKNSFVDEDYSFEFAMMFILGAEISRSIFGANLGESGDLLDLKGRELQSYIEGANDDAEYFLDISDADIQSFVTTLPLNIRTWITSETMRISNGVLTGEIMLKRFIVSGMLFILFQI